VIGKKDGLIFNFATEEERKAWYDTFKTTFKPVEEERKLYGHAGKNVLSKEKLTEVWGGERLHFAGGPCRDVGHHGVLTPWTGPARRAVWHAERRRERV
jgi:hypothetical protein